MKLFQGNDETSATHADRGFTLVELLIVIVILGVLSTVTVFAVSGISSRGEESARDADEATIAGAQEAYFADQGSYGTEADLVSDGLLRNESVNWDIELAADSKSYTLVPAGG